MKIFYTTDFFKNFAKLTGGRSCHSIFLLVTSLYPSTLLKEKVFSSGFCKTFNVLFLQNILFKEPSETKWKRLAKKKDRLKKTDEWFSEWKLVKRVATNGTSDNEWQRVIKNANEWQRITASDKTNESKYNRVMKQNETKDQSGSWRILFNFLCNI